MSDTVPQASDPVRMAFEAWALPLLGDNPTWRNSADCELAWQAWQAGYNEHLDETRASDEAAEIATATRRAETPDPFFAAKPPPIEIWSSEQHLMWFVLRLMTGPYPGWLRDAAKATVRRSKLAKSSLADDALREMEARKDAAYLERNQVVAALATCFPSGVARTAIEGWSEDWHGCVYIDLPTGQVSWHFHDSQAYLFDGLPPYTRSWDGHDTPTKYKRLAALASQPAAEPQKGIT